MISNQTIQFVSIVEGYSVSVSQKVHNSGAWGHNTHNIATSLSTSINGNHRE